MTDKNEVVVKQEEKASLTDLCAAKFHIDPDRMYDLVAKTMITKKSADGPILPEEVAMVMHAMNKYDKDPIMKQLAAFFSKGKLQIMMVHDGWIDEVNKAGSRGFMGITLTESEDLVDVPGTNKKAPVWVEGVGKWTPGANRVDVVYRARFDEWFVPGDNWRTRPSHRIGMKAYDQTARLALGIGLSDEVDRDQFDHMDRGQVRQAASDATQQAMDNLTATMAGGELSEDEAKEVFPEEEPTMVDESDVTPPKLDDFLPVDNATPEPSESPESDDLPEDPEIPAEEEVQAQVPKRAAKVVPSKSKLVCCVPDCGVGRPLVLCAGCKELFCKDHHGNGDRCPACTEGASA